MKAIQPQLFSENPPVSRRVQGGKTTSNLILSAYVGGNREYW